jgi:hypothetical protein
MEILPWCGCSDLAVAETILECFGTARYVCGSPVLEDMTCDAGACYTSSLLLTTWP